MRNDTSRPALLDNTREGVSDAPTDDVPALHDDHPTGCHLNSSGFEMRLQPASQPPLSLSASCSNRAAELHCRTNRLKALVNLALKVRNSKFRLVLVVGAAAAMMAVSVWCLNKTVHATTSKNASTGVVTPPAVTVTTGEARMTQIKDTHTVTGTIWPRENLQVGSEIGGLRIVAVFVQEGDSVVKGQPLLKLNSTLLEAQLLQAKAQLRAAHASLSKAIQPNRNEEIAALQAALAQAEAAVLQEQSRLWQAKVTLTNAELNAQRHTSLASMGAISSQDAENRQLAAETAKEELANCRARVTAAQLQCRQCQERLLAAQRGGRREDVEISRAEIDQVQARICQLEQQIDQTIIRAPDDAVVAAKDANIGNIAPAGTPLFQLIRRNELELRACVLDLDLWKFHQGQDVTVTINEGGPEITGGKVRLIIPMVDPATRRGELRISLPVGTSLRAGMFARGRVQSAARTVITVPSESLVTRGSRSCVFVVGADNRVSDRAVVTGARTEDCVEITSGVSAGERVVTAGARFLSDRDIVEVVQ